MFQSEKAVYHKFLVSFFIKFILQIFIYKEDVHFGKKYRKEGSEEGQGNI